MMRRKPKENNFKAVLETIRDLMNTNCVVPDWLHDLILGYGSPDSAHYSQYVDNLKLIFCIYVLERNPIRAYSCLGCPGLVIKQCIYLYSFFLIMLELYVGGLCMYDIRIFPLTLYEGCKFYEDFYFHIKLLRDENKGVKKLKPSRLGLY